MSVFTPRHLLAELRRLPACRQYWLAYSGGCDSHVLLHALAALGHELPAPIQVLHINHGLHADAAQWAVHCQAVCDELALPLIIQCVNAQPARGESPEAAARQARYAAMAALLGSGGILLTAHHQDDQAETLMLQLLRGAGPHGLAAMPGHKTLAKGFQARPLLGFSQAALRAYAKDHGLQWIEDSSNEDRRFKRNYLRHEIMPRLQQQWPAFNHTLSRSARLCADAATLLDELAAEDLSSLLIDDGLSVAGLALLGSVRQRNVLRYWCASQGLPSPSQVHLQQIQQQMQAAADSNPLICWPGAELRRYQGCLYIMPPLSPVDKTWEQDWDMSQVLKLPHGHLSAIAAKGVGLDAEVKKRAVSVRFRRGGERYQNSASSHQSLKKFFQQHKVAPWQRDRVPLLYVEGELVAIADQVVSKDFVACSGQASLQLLWQPQLSQEG